jgi:hypothetical protein
MPEKPPVMDVKSPEQPRVALTSHDAKYTFFALDVTRVE